LLGATVVHPPASAAASATVASVPASVPPELEPPELEPPELEPPELEPPELELELELVPLSSAVVAGGAGTFWLGGGGSVGWAVSTSDGPTSAVSPLAHAITTPAQTSANTTEPTVPRESDDLIRAL